MYALPTGVTEASSISLFLIMAAGIVAHIIAHYEALKYLIFRHNAMVRLNARVTAHSKEEDTVIDYVLREMLPKLDVKDFTQIKEAKRLLRMDDEQFVNNFIKQSVCKLNLNIKRINGLSDMSLIINSDKDCRRAIDDFNLWIANDLILSGGPLLSCMYLSFYIQEVQKGRLKEETYNTLLKTLHGEVKKDADAFMALKVKGSEKSMNVAMGLVNELKPDAEGIVQSASRIPEKAAMKLFISAIDNNYEKLSPAVNSRLKNMAHSAAEGWEKLNAESRAAFLATCNNVALQISTTETGIDETLNQEIVLQSRVLNSLIK